MATNLNFSLGTSEKYSSLSKKTGTVYFATDTDGRTYIYLNNSNVVPKLLDLRNGGLGAVLTSAPKYSIIMRGAGSYDTTYVAPPSAGGVFFSDGSNKPAFGTLPVKYGGIGRTSISSGAILYGKTSKGVSTTVELSPSANGYVLVSNGSTPTYVAPSMSWTNGSSAGPIFNFTFNNSTIKGVAIPSATGSISGVVTTAAQTFTGIKTFNSSINASAVTPRTTNTYDLGSTTKIWRRIHTHGISFYDANQAVTGSVNGGAVAILTLGNNTANGTAGNSSGKIVLYSSGTGSASITMPSTSNDYTFTLPTPTTARNLNIVASEKTVNTSNGTFYLPIYQEANSVYPKGYIGFQNGYKLTSILGTTEDTTSGSMSLSLGTPSAVGAEGNQVGELRLYGDNSGFTNIRANRSNSTSTYTIYLPAAAGELVYHTENNSQGGAGTVNNLAAYRPVHVSKDGAIYPATTTVASSTRLMYMSNGYLTASIASVANNMTDAQGYTTRLMCLKKGTLTASTANVASGTQLMYLTSGVLTASSANVSNNLTAENGYTSQLMCLNNGVLTASTANVGSNVKFVYLSNGIITVSSSTIGSGTKLMYMSAGSLTESKASLGSTTQPVYLLNGELTAADAYTSLLTAFSGSSSASDNTASITVGGTTKTATIIGGVSNTWANGTSSGPTLSTTVNGKAGTAVAIPSASYSYSGVVTTGEQTLKGTKTFASGIKIANGNSTTDCATLTYDGDTLTISFG